MMSMILIAIALASGSIGAKASVFFGVGNTAVSIEGRHELESDGDTQYYHYDWPCVTAYGVFEVSEETTNSNLAAVFDGGSNLFKVIIGYPDSHSKSFVLHTSYGKKSYAIESGLTSGTYTVSLAKMTEACSTVVKIIDCWLNSPVKFYGFEIDGATATAGTIPNKKYKIEVFGDSWSNGFGINAPHSDSTCVLQTKKYQDCTLGYQRHLADALDSHLHVEAWSAHGVVRNAWTLIGESTYPMPYFWPFSLATDHNSQWKWELYQPDLVIVYLGSNDYAMKTLFRLSESKFKAGYIKMLDTISKTYGQTTSILCVCGGFKDERGDYTACPYIKDVVNTYKTSSVVEYVEIPEDLLKDSMKGCKDHFNVEGHKVVAKFLEPTVAEMLKNKGQ